MACEVVKVPGGTAILCGKRRHKPEPCVWCRQPSTKQCDFRLSPQNQVTHIRTCDVYICDKHATSVGLNLDYCPTHAETLPVLIDE